MAFGPNNTCTVQLAPDASVTPLKHVLAGSENCAASDPPMLNAERVKGWPPILENAMVSPSLLVFSGWLPKS